MLYCLEISFEKEIGPLILVLPQESSQGTGCRQPDALAKCHSNGLYPFANRELIPSESTNAGPLLFALLLEVLFPSSS